MKTEKEVQELMSFFVQQYCKTRYEYWLKTYQQEDEELREELNELETHSVVYFNLVFALAEVLDLYPNDIRLELNEREIDARTRAMKHMIKN